MENWPFLDQNHALTPLEKCQFFVFLIFFFYRLERRFFVLDYLKRHFLGLYWPKNNSWKKGDFWTKTMGYPLGENVILSSFWTSCFYSLERRFFVLEYRKRDFPGLYCLKKKNLEKWQFLDENHGLTPLEKCEFFDFLNFVFLKPREAFFLPRISYKNIFLAYFSLKKKFERCRF